MNKYCRLFILLVLILTAAFLAYAQTSRATDETIVASGSHVRSTDEAKSDTSLDTKPAISDPLVRVLFSKGLLTLDEARAVTTGGTALEQRDRLAALLRDKGLISAGEFEAVRAV